MAGIFISYAHEDQGTARRIVDALAREGLDAWWDHEIPPGRSWDDVIGTRIASADVAIVIWSARSVGSNFVKEEAQLALDAGKLLPVKVDEVDPPMGFRRVHAANLAGWRGESDHRQWRALLDEIRARLGSSTSARPAAAARPARAYEAPAAKQGGGKPPAWLFAVGAVAALALVGFLFLANNNNNPAPAAPAIEVAATDATEAPAAEPPAESPASAAAPSGTSVDPRSIEMQYWQSCCASGGSESDYRAYLSRYPRGEFASLARSRVAAIQQASAPAPSASAPAPAAAPSLSGTYWVGPWQPGIEEDVPVRFDAGGTAKYTLNNGDSWQGSLTWSQNGSNIEFQWYNDIVRGTISGNRITGSVTRDGRHTHDVTLRPWSQ